MAVVPFETASVMNDTRENCMQVDLSNGMIAYLAQFPTDNLWRIRSVEQNRVVGSLDLSRIGKAPAGAAGIAPSGMSLETRNYMRQDIADRTFQTKDDAVRFLCEEFKTQAI